MPALLPRPSILSIEPYVGGESKIPGVNRIIKLSSNEGAFGVPPGARPPMPRWRPSCTATPMAAARRCARRSASASASIRTRWSAATVRTS